jgi:phytol kinase
LETFILPLEITPDLWSDIAIAGIWLGFTIILAESLYRLRAIDSEKVRKIVHIGAGQVILLAWWLQIPAWVGIAASFVASTVALLSYKYPILPGINSVGRKSLGTFFYALSIGILVAWFWPLQQPQYAAIGILVMTWGDGLAALIGQQYGKHRYQIGGIQKSWEGSTTMAAVSFLVTSLILLAVGGNIWQICLVSAAVAVIATSLEAFSVLGIDNLTVPLGSAAIAYFFNQSFF